MKTDFAEFVVLSDCDPFLSSNRVKRLSEIELRPEVENCPRGLSLPFRRLLELAVFTRRVPRRNFWADFRRYHRCLEGRGFSPQFKVRDGFKFKSLKRFLLLLT